MNRASPDRVVSDGIAAYADRARRYHAGRPGYPLEVTDLLSTVAGVPVAATIADVASGTGVMTEFLLDAGYRVVAVEPGNEMRTQAEQRLGHRAGFTSVAGSAEATGLPDDSVDAVTVAQALHWFDLDAARAEFGRILRHGGPIILLWNDWDREHGPGADIHSALLAELPAYRAMFAREPDVVHLARRFLPQDADLVVQSVPHVQRMQQFSVLCDRFMSASYAPKVTDPEAASLGRHLEKIFLDHAHDGTLSLEYRLTVIIARLDEATAP